MRVTYYWTSEGAWLLCILLPPRFEKTGVYSEHRCSCHLQANRLGFNNRIDYLKNHSRINSNAQPGISERIKSLAKLMEVCKTRTSMDGQTDSQVAKNRKFHALVYSWLVINVSAQALRWRHAAVNYKEMYWSIAKLEIYESNKA